VWCHKHKIILPFCPFFYHLICGAVENKKGRKKIVVDFVNIGKHLFSLASYTRLSLSLSLSVFLIFGCTFFYFALSLRLALLKNQKIFLHFLQRKDTFRRLFLYHLCVECVQHKGYCYSLILRVVPLESRSHRVSLWVARLNL
jgi:hypothetical protein